MPASLLSQFLLRYEQADTLPEKALALYNGGFCVLGREGLSRLLGENAAPFLAYIQALQQEDADGGHALAHLQDAPSSVLLGSLYEKLRTL